MFKLTKIRFLPRSETHAYHCWNLPQQQFFSYYFISTSFPFPFSARTRHHFSLSFICTTHRASRGVGRVRINTNRYSPEEFSALTHLVRRTGGPDWHRDRRQKPSSAFEEPRKPLAGYCPETGKPKWTKWRDMAPGALFTSAPRPLFSSKRPGSSCFLSMGGRAIRGGRAHLTAWRPKAVTAQGRFR